MGGDLRDGLTLGLPPLIHSVLPPLDSQGARKMVSKISEETVVGGDESGENLVAAVVPQEEVAVQPIDGQSDDEVNGMAVQET